MFKKFFVYIMILMMFIPKVYATSEVGQVLTDEEFYKLMEEDINKEVQTNINNQTASFEYQYADIDKSEEIKDEGAFQYSSDAEKFAAMEKEKKENEAENFSDYIEDVAGILQNENTSYLMNALKSFYGTTGIKPMIKTIDSAEGKKINEVAKDIYTAKFGSDKNHLLILIAKDKGDMIIIYGEEESEIVDKVVVDAMMTSVETDFAKLKIADGLTAALNNGSVLIQENIKNTRQDNHEVLEIKDTSQENRLSLIFCIISGLFIIFNFVLLLKDKILSSFNIEIKNKE